MSGDFTRPSQHDPKQDLIPHQGFRSCQSFRMAWLFELRTLHDAYAV